MRGVRLSKRSGYSVTIPPFPAGSDVRTALSDTTPDARLLGRLNVRYVVAEFPIRAEGLVEQAHFGSTFVYENQFVLPRAYVGEGMAARIVINTPDRVVVEADGPGTLTLIQIHYPGWRATVDGRARAYPSRGLGSDGCEPGRRSSSNRVCVRSVDGQGWRDREWSRVGESGVRMGGRVGLEATMEARGR